MSNEQAGWQALERADRNYRVAKIIAVHLKNSGNFEQLIAIAQANTNLVGCCGEGSFEVKQRNIEEQDWRKVLSVLEQARLLE